MKPIPGYADYFATEAGEVWSGKYRELRQLKTSKHKKGYRLLTLRKNNKSHTVTLHSIVALTFIGPRPTGLDVCHENHDPSDNRVSNLYYGTRKHNCQMSAAVGHYGHHRKGVKPASAKLVDVQILEIRELYATGKYKQADLAKLFGVVQCRISQIVRSDTSGKAYPRRVHRVLPLVPGVYAPDGCGW